MHTLGGACVGTSKSGYLIGNLTLLLAYLILSILIRAHLMLSVSTYHVVYPRNFYAQHDTARLTSVNVGSFK